MSVGRIMMALGGWSTEQMMGRYAALRERTLRSAAEAVSGAAGPLVQQPHCAARGE